MRKNKLVFIALVVAAVAVAGCAHRTLRADFGNSTKINLAAQTVNQAAAAQAPAVNTVDGQKVEAVLNRYRNEKADATRGKLLSGLGN